MWILNKIKKRKGLNFTEILMATAALAILMLGFSQFTADIFNVSATHASQMDKVSRQRLISERILTQISKAAYIYPPNINITLSNGVVINTSNSIAALIPDPNEKYIFTAYYINNNLSENADLYEFTSDISYFWAKDYNPAANMLSFNGSIELLAENINPAGTFLSYVMNYENAPYDQSLKGESSGTTSNSSNALIKGINWIISQESNNNELIQIKGISRNVPRFIE